MSDLANSKITIGLLIDWTNNPYHLELIRGIRKAIHKHDVNLIVYVGGAINSPTQFEANRNIVYNLVSPYQVDGLIIASASLMRTCTLEQLTTFCHGFASLPVVTIGQVVRNLHFIGTDNITGMKELMHHLIHVHTYRKFAFLKGTDGSKDADERFEIYRTSLEQAGIECNPENIFQGHFMYRFAAEIMTELFEKGKPDFDVIVCANDDMAIGVLSVLEKQGISVPGDIAVVGFDDQHVSKFLHTPLTTVSQQIFMQGFTATESCISLIKGEKINTHILLPTQFIPRDSCGCVTFPGIDCEEFMGFNENKEKKPVFHSDIRELIQELKKKEYIKNKNDEEKIKGALTGLLDSISTTNTKKFLKELKTIFSLSGLFFREQNSIAGLYTTIRQYIISSIDEEEKRTYTHYLFNIGLSRYADRQYRNNQYTHYVEDREMDILLRTIENLVAAMEMDDLARILGNILPKIGIKKCYLSLYENPESDKSLSISRLIFAVHEKGEIHVPRTRFLFPTKKLYPDYIIPGNKSYTLYIEPLFFSHIQLGFCVFEYISIGETLWYTVRRLFVAIALKAAFYVQKVQLDFIRYEEKVKTRTRELSSANELLTRLYNAQKEAEEKVRLLNVDLENRVKQRTCQLEDINNQLRETLHRLKATQAKLVEVEKMAALGSLVAGIAHEINTPVGIGVTAASHLDSLTEDLVKLYQENNLKRSDLEEFISTSKEASSLVLSNLKRAYELIRNFKKIAVDQSTEEKRKIRLRKYLDDILLSLRPKLKNTSHIMEIVCDKDLVIYSHAGAFYQVVTNLIINSLIHGFDKKKQGIIKIHIKIRDNRLFFRYFDNGKGIYKNDLKKIFDPFFTTKRNKGGTGLGLHLVYNIVTQTLGGTIKCISRPGEGTLFKIVVPV